MTGGTAGINEGSFGDCHSSIPVLSVGHVGAEAHHVRLDRSQVRLPIQTTLILQGKEKGDFDVLL